MKDAFLSVAVAPYLGHPAISGKSSYFYWGDKTFDIEQIAYDYSANIILAVFSADGELYLASILN
jgi:hypothetical protein